VARLISGGDVLYCKEPDQGSSNAAEKPDSIAVPKALNDKRNCRDPRSQRDNECQSWRQAEAAEDQACVARRQFYVGVFIGLWGLIGLAGTVIFTKQAADGALAAAKAAEASADTADKTLLATQATAKRQLRAYVTIVGGHMRVKNVNGQPSLEIFIQFKNSGQTPGERLATWRDKAIGNPKDRPFTDAPPPDKRGPTSIIGPGATADLTTFIIGVSNDDGNAIIRGAKRVFVWGEIGYRDIFGKDHFLRFKCTNSDHNTDGVWALAPHEDGYETDQEMM